MLAYFCCDDFDSNNSKEVFKIFKAFIDRISSYFPQSSITNEGTLSLKSKLKDMQVNRKHKVGEKIASGANAFEVVVDKLKKGKNNPGNTASVVVVEELNDEEEKN